MQRCTIGLLVILTLAAAVPLAAIGATTSAQSPRSAGSEGSGRTDKEHLHAVHSCKGFASWAMWKGQNLVHGTPRHARVSPTDCRRLRLSWSSFHVDVIVTTGGVTSDPCGHAGDHDHPHRHGGSRGTRGDRSRRQPGAARRERHRAVLVEVRTLRARRLQLLKEAGPRVARVAVLYHPPFPAIDLESARGAGRGASFESDRAADGGAHSGWASMTSLPVMHQVGRRRLAYGCGALCRGASPTHPRLAAMHRLPTACGERYAVRRGACISYSASLAAIVSACGVLCGQNSQGRQARRPARGAADEIRAGHQPQDRQGAGAHDTSLSPGPGGRGDPMKALALIAGIARAIGRCSGAPPSSWTRASKAPHQWTCPWNAPSRP